MVEEVIDNRQGIPGSHSNRGKTRAFNGHESSVKCISFWEPFRTDLVPGPALLVLVGGTATISPVLLHRRHRSGLLGIAISAVMIPGFEGVGVLVIARPNGQGNARKVRLC